VSETPGKRLSGSLSWLRRSPLLLYSEIGIAYAAGLSLLTIAGFAGFRCYRSMRPAEPPGIRCLNCGERLPSSARRCDVCGSASWTYRN
jgi:hypothetical protein